MRKITFIVLVSVLLLSCRDSRKNLYQGEYKFQFMQDENIEVGIDDLNVYVTDTKQNVQIVYECELDAADYTNHALLRQMRYAKDVWAKYDSEAVKRWNVLLLDLKSKSYRQMTVYDKTANKELDRYFVKYRDVYGPSIGKNNHTVTTR